jgi:hypothetical protein
MPGGTICRRDFPRGGRKVDELLKRLSEMDQLAMVQLNYQKTLALLAAMKAGQVGIEDVVLTEGGWTVSSQPAEATPEVVDQPGE